MKVQPLYNANFTGIFRRKQKNNASKVQNIHNQTPKEETPTIKLGEYSFIEGPDKRKFFANYPHHLQESYIITNNGFTTYEVTRKSESGTILENAQFAFDNVVITSSKNGYKESVYFKSGKKDKSITYDFNGNMKQKTIYSDSDENIISEIDDYDRGMLSKVTTFYPQHQKDVLFVAGHGIAKISYIPENRKPKEVMEFDKNGSVINEISYYPNGNISEKVEYNENGDKKMTLYTQEGCKEQELQYDSQNKLKTIVSFNEFGNITTKVVFDEFERPVMKYVNDDSGNLLKTLEYNREKGSITTKTYNAQGLIESVNTENAENADCEEL